MKTDKSCTIYALASAPGRAGVSVIRCSGPGTVATLASLLEKKKEGSGDVCGFSSGPVSAPSPLPALPSAAGPSSNSAAPDIAAPGSVLPPPRYSFLCKIIDPDSSTVSRETIDRCLVVWFRGPASFTGEDVVEYHLHGSPAAVRHLLDVLSRRPGHRLAAPGEFTRRAFENGKIDLTEAEAVADLVNAETAFQKAQALWQMDGALSRLYEGWREDLVRALAHLEADIDFPDEDLPEGVASQVRPRLERLAAEVRTHLDDGRRGERLRDGIQIAVVGAPNAGKSSLVNALAGRDVAIVSEHAGTTRDIIEVALDLGGYPVVVADTAGLRPDQLGTGPQDVIESEGIRRALDRARMADIKLLLFDAAALPARDPHTAALAGPDSLAVFNKADLMPDGAAREEGAVYISAQTGQGLETLVAALTNRAARLAGTGETPSLTRRRHRLALEECLAALDRTLDGGGGRMPELVAEDVRLAVRALGRITGRVDVEDLLDVVFRDFCIGK